MSWSVTGYSQQKRDVKPVKSEDLNKTAFKSMQPDDLSTKLVSHNHLRNEEPKRSRNGRRCFNCVSATHLLKNCRVPLVSVRRTNYHCKTMKANHQKRNRSNDQNSCKPSVYEKFKPQQLEQNRLETDNEIYLDANVGQNKTSLCALLDAGSN